MPWSKCARTNYWKVVGVTTGFMLLMIVSVLGLTVYLYNYGLSLGLIIGITGALMVLELFAFRFAQDSYGDKMYSFASKDAFIKNLKKLQNRSEGRV